MSNTQTMFLDGVADFQHQLEEALNTADIKVQQDTAAQVATMNMVTDHLSAGDLAARIRNDGAKHVFIATSTISEDYQQLTVSWKKGDGYMVVIAKDWGGSRRWVIHDQLLKDQRVTKDDAWKTDNTAFRKIAEDYLQDADKSIGEQALNEWLDQIAYDIEEGLAS